MDELRDGFTIHLLRKSGLTQGMKVLDVGSGSGDVSFLAKELVGSTGQVVGIDVSEYAIQFAKDRYANSDIRFLQADLMKLPEDLGEFDAIIGRRVLMYLPDARTCILALKSHLKPGGKMIFQESDCMAEKLIDSSLIRHIEVQKWIWKTIEAEGGNAHIGSEMYSLFKKCGLEIHSLCSEITLHTAETGSDIGWVAKMMKPRFVKCGIVSEDLDEEQLERDLEEELKSSSVPFVRDTPFGICAVYPGKK